MSSGGFSTPLLRPAADPPSPPEFHLTPAALEVPALSQSSELLLTHSGNAPSSCCSPSHSLSSNLAEEQRRRDREQQQIRQQDNAEDEDAQMKGVAWVRNPHDSFPMHGEAAVAAASQAAATRKERAEGMSPGPVARSRSRTPIMRARSSSWARGSTSSTPSREDSTKAPSSVFLGSAHYQHIFHTFPGSTDHLPLLRSHARVTTRARHSLSSACEPRITISTVTKEEPQMAVSATAVAPVPADQVPATAADLGGLQPETDAMGGGETDHVEEHGTGQVILQEPGNSGFPTVSIPSDPLLSSHMADGGSANTAAEIRGNPAAAGSKGTPLRVPCEAASKMLIDAQSPSSRGSVSSTLTSSTRCSPSGSGALDEQERAVLLFMLQQQHMRQLDNSGQQQLKPRSPAQHGQESLRAPRKEVVCCAMGGTEIAVTESAEQNLSMSGNSVDAACLGRAAPTRAVREVIPVNKCEEAERGDRTGGEHGEAAKETAQDKEEAGAAHSTPLTPRPFSGLSPAAQKGLPEEGKAAGVFERIWADLLRREVVQQQAATPMLEPAQATPLEGGKQNLHGTAPSMDPEEHHQQEQRQHKQAGQELGGVAQEQLQQQDHRLLVSAEQRR